MQRQVPSDLAHRFREASLQTLGALTVARRLLTSLSDGRSGGHPFLDDVEQLLQPGSAPLSRVVQAYNATLDLLHTFTFSYLAYSTEGDMDMIQQRAQTVQQQVVMLQSLMADLQGQALNMPEPSLHGLDRIRSSNRENALLCGAALFACASAALLYRRHVVAGLITLLPAPALGAYGMSALLNRRSSAAASALVSYSSLQERYQSAKSRAQKMKVLRDALFECASSMLELCDAAQAVAELAASMRPSMSEREYDSIVAMVLRPVYIIAQDTKTRFTSQC